MKTVLVFLSTVLCLAACVSAADAPVDKGSVMLEGSVFFASQTGDLYEADGDGAILLSFTPAAGFFVAPGVLIGGNLGVQYVTVGDYSRTDLTIGPIIGYYFNHDPTRTEFKGAVYPYMKAFFNYGRQDVDYGFWDGSADMIQVGGQGGLVLMMSNAVGVDFAFQISSETWSNGDSESGLTIMAGAGITSFIF